MYLNFNNTLQIDRLWPRAKHGWQIDESEERVFAKAPQKSNARIVDAYWIDDKQRKHFDLNEEHAEKKNIAQKLADF